MGRGRENVSLHRDVMSVNDDRGRGRGVMQMRVGREGDGVEMMRGADSEIRDRRIVRGNDIGDIIGETIVMNRCNRYPSLWAQNTPDLSECLSECNLALMGEGLDLAACCC